MDNKHTKKILKIRAANRWSKESNEQLGGFFKSYAIII